MYPREITKLILDLEAKGYTAELTRQWLLENRQLKIHLNTIYNHRKGPVAKEIIEQMMIQQQQDITIATQKGDYKTAMHYRNEMLKLLVPIKTEILTQQYSVSKEEIKVEQNKPSASDFNNELEEALRIDAEFYLSKKQQVHTTHSAP